MSSSLSSDDLFSSSSSSGSGSPATTPSPSSSRCPSPSASSAPALPSQAFMRPQLKSQPQFSLVPRGKPFPEDISLNDIEPTDALLFFPDANTAPTRAILLVGPAIARHINQQRSSSPSLAPTREKKTLGSARMHPYRIVVKPSRGEATPEPCGISHVQQERLMRDHRRRSSVNLSASVKWSEWAQGTSARTSRTLAEEWEAIVKGQRRRDSSNTSSGSDSEMESLSSSEE